MRCRAFRMQLSAEASMCDGNIPDAYLKIYFVNVGEILVPNIPWKFWEQISFASKYLEHAPPPPGGILMCNRAEATYRVLQQNFRRSTFLPVATLEVKILTFTLITQWSQWMFIQACRNKLTNQWFGDTQRLSLVSLVTHEFDLLLFFFCLRITKLNAYTDLTILFRVLIYLDFIFRL
jgi:hypothetical protein